MLGGRVESDIDKVTCNDRKATRAGSDSDTAPSRPSAENSDHCASQPGSSPELPRRPSFLTKQGQYAMVSVCNQDGKIGWLDSSEVVVESVDGQSVSEAFE